MHATLTAEPGVLCQATTRPGTNFVVTASHSTTRPFGDEAAQCDRPSPKSCTSRNARMNLGKFSKSLQKRNTLLTE